MIVDWLRALGAIDISHLLPHDNWIIGERESTTSLTWHYNGPEVPSDRQHGEGLIDQLRADAEWQMRPGWGGTKDGAPHLMYHIAIDALGTIYVTTANIQEILWHCAHQEGNGRGIALHYPLGGKQEPTTAQLAAGIRVSDAIRARYKLDMRRVFGHLEWKHATACPGTSLMRHLAAYRDGRTPVIVPTPVPAGMRLFKIKPDLGANAQVRQAPRKHWPDGREVPVAGRLKPGTIIFVDVVKSDGEAIAGDTRWVHMARVPHEQADLGFLSMTLLQEVR